MIFRELSSAAFRFSLRQPGAEIMGGGAFKRPPPPSRRWKIQRPSRARVKLFNICGHSSRECTKYAIERQKRRNGPASQLQRAAAKLTLALF